MVNVVIVERIIVDIDVLVTTQTSKNNFLETNTIMKVNGILKVYVKM